MRANLILTLLLCACSSGCSGLVRGFVDTQPRVSLDDRAISDPRSVVGGDPVAMVPSGEVDGDCAGDPDLLNNAPIIVQGFQPAATTPQYPYEDDAPGSPRLSADGARVRIDTSRPRLFARVEHASIGGAQVKQLVYAFWYPRRPVGSIETGSVDGGVVRLTLDEAGRPAVIEYTQPCGCFHGVFVSEEVDTAAALQFGPPAPRRVHAVEPPLTGHDDWVVRDLVRLVPDGRIVLYISAGKHACQAIRSERPDSLDALIGQTRPYSIAPYSSLEHIPRDGGGEASMFDRNGLVIGAERKAEQFVMGDLDHAGWPRHLDKMLIHWDTERWTDPTLLATKLRLPTPLTSHAVTTNPAQPVAPSPSPQPPPGAAKPAADGRQLLLFTNARCAGCQLTKRSITESPSLQKAIRAWNYKVIDTATPEGEQLAAEWRITMVPVLVGLDRDRELFREDDIDTADKIAAVVTSHQ